MWHASVSVEKPEQLCSLGGIQRPLPRHVATCPGMYLQTVAPLSVKALFLVARLPGIAGWLSDLFVVKLYLG